MNSANIRKPAVAGQFYPGNEGELRGKVEAYMSASGIEPAPEQVVALVVPHAGYVYSGPTAGCAYARVQGKKPKRVIVSGCSHRYPVETASVYTSGAFDTPVGAFPIDEEFAHAVAEETQSFSTKPHNMEHSLEVQLPFLEAAIGTTPIVPILFGGLFEQWHAEMGRKIAEMADETDLFIASTDLSHYLPEEQANEIDRRTIDELMKQEPLAFARAIGEGKGSMCGSSSVVTAMAFALAMEAKRWSLLDYRTSAKVSGDYDRVVGYAAVSMEKAA